MPPTLTINDYTPENMMAFPSSSYSENDVLANHESAHAVVACELDRGIGQVEIIKPGDRGRVTGPYDSFEEALEHTLSRRDILVTLAGPAYQSRCLGHSLEGEKGESDLPSHDLIAQTARGDLEGLSGPMFAADLIEARIGVEILGRELEGPAERNFRARAMKPFRNEEWRRENHVPVREPVRDWRHADLFKEYWVEAKELVHLNRYTIEAMGQQLKKNGVLDGDYFKKEAEKIEGDPGQPFLGD